MTQFAVIEASRRHCGQIARKLRAEHEAGSRSVIKFGTHEGISVAFLMSSANRAWMIDGRLAAVGGIITTFASSDGVIWLAVAQEATRYPKAMLKTAREWLTIFGENKRTLRITVILADKPSVRFAEHLGFYPTGEVSEDDKMAVMQLNCGGE